MSPLYIQPCTYVGLYYWFSTFNPAAVFALEKDEYFVNETAGVVRIGVVKKSGSIDAGQSITVVVTPMQGTGATQGAGTYEWKQVTRGYNMHYDG